MRSLNNLRAGALCMLLATPVAADIYRWVDEAGRVSYGDVPPVHADARAVPLVRPGSGEGGTADAASDRLLRQQRLLQSYAYERAQRRAFEAQRASRQREIAAYCDNLHVTWQRLAYRGPVYERSPAGEQVFLDDRQREARKAAVRDQHRRSCTGELR